MWANPIAMIPEIKNRKDSNRKGGASNIEILAEVNALDHIRAKAIPSVKSRIFIKLKVKKKATMR